MFLWFGTETRRGAVSQKGAETEQQGSQYPLLDEGGHAHFLAKQQPVLLYPEKEKYLTEDEAAAALTYQHKTDRTIASTHQAMPVSAGKLPNTLTRTNAGSAQQGLVWPPASQRVTAEVQSAVKKTLHLTINGVLHPSMREISGKRASRRQTPSRLWKTLTCTQTVHIFLSNIP